MSDAQVYLVMVGGFVPLVCMIADGLRKPKARHFVGAFATAAVWYGLCLWKLAA